MHDCYIAIRIGSEYDTWVFLLSCPCPSGILRSKVCRQVGFHHRLLIFPVRSIVIAIRNRETSLSTTVFTCIHDGLYHPRLDPSALLMLLPDH